MVLTEKEQLNDELEDLTNVVENAGDDSQESIASDLYSISSFGADLDAEALIKRMNRGQYYVPDFQRQYVWSRVDASKFIESLLLGLPVPGIFLYQENDSTKHLVIDGQQRLKSLKFYFDGLFNERKFRLTGLKTKWDGMAFKELDQDDQERLECAVIHATIFKQDTPVDNMDSVYEVFERINTGGLKLSPQEIRSCVAHGEFNAALFTFNDSESWRSIYGKKSNRLKDIELILRFFAFKGNLEEYKPPMKKFLTDYMVTNRDMEENLVREFGEIWELTISRILEALGAKVFREGGRAMNVAFFDSFSVATSLALDKNPDLTNQNIQAAYESLLDNLEYLNATQSGTAGATNVFTRFNNAIASFGL